jgi:hypothetical protein
MGRRAVPFLLLVACASPSADPEADRAELLRMRFVAAGEVTVISPAENRARLQAYFDRSTFQAWDDITPPILRISPDGRMAYKIVQKRVRLTAPDSSGRPVAEHVVYAWIEMYEKPDDRWVLMAVASTDRPGP